MTNTNADIEKKKNKNKADSQYGPLPIQDAQIACYVLEVERKNPYSLDFSTLGEEIQLCDFIYCDQ